MKIRMLPALIFALLSTSANADTLVKGSMLGQPQIMLSKGKTNGCGVRIVGGNEITKPTDTLRGFDISFVIYSQPFALFKGVASKPVIGQQLLDNKRPPDVPLKSYWVKAKGADASAPLDGKVIPGETKHSLLYGSDIDSTLRILKAVLNREEIWVGVQRVGDPAGQVVYGVVQITDSDVEQTRQCMGELLASMDAQDASPK